MIVDGTEQFLGNDAAHAQKAIQHAAQGSKLSLSLSKPVVDGRKVSASVSLSAAATAQPRGDLYAALVDPVDVTDVRKGENGGHTPAARGRGAQPATRRQPEEPRRRARFVQPDCPGRRQAGRDAPRRLRPAERPGSGPWRCFRSSVRGCLKHGHSISNPLASFCNRNPRSAVCI